MAQHGGTEPNTVKVYLLMGKDVHNILLNEKRRLQE